MPKELGWLDTNVFVHALYANDKPHKRSIEILDALADGSAQGWLDPIVVHELTYLFTNGVGQFQGREDSRDFLLDIVRTPAIHAADKDVLIGAIMHWSRSTIDFADAWLSVLSRHRALPVCSANRRDFIGVPNTF
jgi:predicted nucleic acid-binding protein